LKNGLRNSEENNMEKLTPKETKTIEEIVQKIFALLEIDGTFTIEENGESVDVMMETKDTGIVIGYHGEILESLQLILSLAVAKKIGRFVRISIEVDDYKKNRMEYLHNLANQVKEKAIAENKEQVLLSLKSWERRVIHLYLQDDDQVTSESSGEGKERVLLIKPKA
jgi:spoIIIJ-associated protein